MVKSATMPQLPDWEITWTVQEASAATGYNAEYIRRLVRNKEIEAVKIGFVWLINGDSLKDYIERVEDLDDSRYGPKK
jgi:excisionase family DNA binding protein